MTITHDLCQAAAETQWGDLPPNAVDAARRLILDGIAIAVAGSREEGAPRLLAAHLQALGGAASCTVVGFGFRTSPVQAAYLNGASMHVLDYEPMWSPPNHAVSTTLPAVLALAEALQSDGRQVMTALVKGCEAQQVLREASGQVEPKDLLFHPPGVVGGIGAAIAAGHLLGLDADALCHAVGIAASRAGGLLANVGSMTKCLHCGMAGASGVDAALLAARGFTANPDVLGAPRGYLEAYFGAHADAAALTKYGHPFRVADPGYAIKMYPSQFATHYAISAAIEVFRQLSARDVVESARLTGPVMPYVDRPRPATGLEGKFSFQYAAACGLLDGAVGIESFRDERLSRPDMRRLLPRIEFVQSAEIPGTLTGMHVALDVGLESGKRVGSTCRQLRGAWGSPPIPLEEHLQKVSACLEPGLGREGSQRLIHEIQRFETLDAGELARLIGGLGGAAA